MFITDTFYVWFPSVRRIDDMDLNESRRMACFSVRLCSAGSTGSYPLLLLIIYPEHVPHISPPVHMTVNITDKQTIPVYFFNEMKIYTSFNFHQDNHSDFELFLRSGRTYCYLLPVFNMGGH